MLLDDETGKHSRPPQTRRNSPSPGRPPKRVGTILSAVFAVVLVGGAAVIAKQHIDSTPTAAATLTAPVITAHSANPQDSASPLDSANPRGSAKATKKASAQPPWASWPLKFDATFQGTQLDTSVWATCYAYATHGCTNFGNKSDPEKQWYLPSQDQVSGGELHLVAQQESTPGYSESGAPKEYACRSGIVTSLPGFNFEYGYTQVTAQIPFGGGLWSALWLGATNQKWPPEIDILEHWHSEPYGKAYLHPLGGDRQGGKVDEPGLGAGWHTFGLYWTPTKLAWYYDGNQVFATSTGVPHQDMYILMNVADDADGPGTCTGSMNIRSVKVWQEPR